MGILITPNDSVRITENYVADKVTAALRRGACALHPAPRYLQPYNNDADCSYCFWHAYHAGSRPETAAEVAAFEHYYTYNDGVRRRG